jgi:hypothetical protein
LNFFIYDALRVDTGTIMHHFGVDKIQSVLTAG